MPPGEAALRKQVEALEKKLAMSRRCVMCIMYVHRGRAVLWVMGLMGLKKKLAISRRYGSVCAHLTHVVVWTSRLRGPWEEAGHVLYIAQHGHRKQGKNCPHR